MSKRQQDRRARHAQETAADAATAATARAAAAAGSAASRTAAAVQRAGEAIEHHGRTSAPAVGSAVGTAVDTAVDGAGSARALVERWGGAAAGVAGELVETVHGIVEEPTVRGGAALDALRGRPVGRPAARRWWPWALLAAVVGAAGGAAVAAAVRRVGGTDAPGAQEPHELRAVVDVVPDATVGTDGTDGTAEGRPAEHGPLA